MYFLCPQYAVSIRHPQQQPTSFPSNMGRNPHHPDMPWLCSVTSSTWGEIFHIFIQGLCIIRCHPHMQSLIQLWRKYKPVIKPTLNHSSYNFLSVQSRSIIHPIFTFVNLVNKLRLFQRTWQLINHESVWIVNILCKQNKCREALQLNKQRNNYLSSDPSLIQGWLHFTSTGKLFEKNRKCILCWYVRCSFPYS